MSSFHLGFEQPGMKDDATEDFVVDPGSSLPLEFELLRMTDEVIEDSRVDEV